MIRTFLLLFLAMPLVSAMAIAQSKLSQSQPSPKTPIFSGADSFQNDKRKNPQVLVPPSIIPGTLINSSNAAPLRKVLPAEVMTLVQEGRLSFEIGEALRYQWRYPDTFMAAPLENAAGKKLLLNEEGGITGPLRYGLAFPLSDIRPERDSEKAPQHREAGFRLLWAIHSLWWSQRYFDYSGNLRWMLGDREYALELRLRRLYRGIAATEPNTLSIASTANLLFKERLSITSPAPLSEISFLSFRTRGSDEDALWIYSPAIERIRQLTGSNRSDDIFSSALSLDDFFGFSAKSELLDAYLEKEQVMLVPFPFFEKMPILERDSCGEVTISSDSDSEAESSHGGISHGGIQQQAKGEFAFPVPTMFVPRHVWQVVVTSKDPFSLYGRQELFIDSATLLPVYKIIYDRSGQLKKTVIAVFGLAESENEKFMVLPAFQVQFDRAKQVTSMLSGTHFRVCPEPPSDLDGPEASGGSGAGGEAIFELKNIAPPSKASAKATPTPKTPKAN